jgi:hypothetical protein
VAAILVLLMLQNRKHEGGVMFMCCKVTEVGYNDLEDIMAAQHPVTCIT